MTNDMTRGNPTRLIISFTLPVLFGNLCQQLYGMVDSIIVGRAISMEALAAVGATSGISFLVIGCIQGLTAGFSVITAQRFGAGYYEGVKRSVATSALLSLAATVLLTAAGILTARPLLEVMNTPADIIEDSYAYIIVIYYGVAATAFYNLLSCIIRALGDSKTPLVFLGISSVLNIILDLTFIIVFKWGVFGASFATVISQGISALLCLFYTIKNYDILRFDSFELKPDLEKMKKLVVIGVPMALQFSITAIGSIILQSAVNTLGKTAVASMTAAIKIQTVAVGPMESMGITMATYCGQNRGARKYSRITAGIGQSIAMTMVYSVAACAAVSFLGGALTTLFIDKNTADSENIQKIIDLSVYYLRINGLFYPFLGVLFIIRNSLQGMGYSMLPMLAGVSELAARSLVAILFVS